MAADARWPRASRASAAPSGRLHRSTRAAFVVLLATGLVLYLPMLAQIVSDRPLIKAIHLVAAAAWLTALALIALARRPRALRRDAPRPRPLRPPTTCAGCAGGRRRGRFNAGQKAHAIVQAALAVLFVVSGTLLWLGERNTAFRLPGTIALHDVAMFVAVVLVAGHVAMALPPSAALEGMLYGTVPADWAAEHHAAWTPAPPPPRGAPGSAGSRSRSSSPPRASPAPCCSPPTRSASRRPAYPHMCADG